jgi:hypothetical protein
MASKPQTVFHAFYRRLLMLYPRPFRERFSESIEQTFDDLAKERQEHMLLFTLHVSFGTAIGIVRENVAHFSQRGVMTEIVRNQRVAAVTAILLFLPGAILFSLMLLGIEPSLGPLQTYLQPSDPESPHLLGSLIFLTLIVVFPAAAVVIALAATGGKPFKGTASTLGIASVVGFLLVLPFILLELRYGQGSYSSFPFPLFGILWLLPTLLAAAIAPLVQAVRLRGSLGADPFALVMRIAFIVLIGTFWIGLVQDQMPCFLGVPNCD